MTTRDEARTEIRAALLAWRASGEEDPLIPVYDEDGDGVPDSYGLDEDDIVLVSGATIEGSVSVSTGEEGF